MHNLAAEIIFNIAITQGSSLDLRWCTSKPFREDGGAGVWGEGCEDDGEVEERDDQDGVGGKLSCCIRARVSY